MQTFLLAGREVALDPEALSSRLLLDSASAEFAELLALCRQAARAARPRALYGPAYIEGRGDDWALIEGVKFESRVLAVNLAPVERAFPFIATMGMELERFGGGSRDPLEREALEAVKDLALLSALEAVNRHLAEQFGIRKSSMMNPGSIEDWPLSEQTSLFQLLGDPEARLGIKLLDSLMMSPSRTVSGLRFASEFDFESCLLCPREACPVRRAPYDPGLYRKRYAGKS